MTTNENQIKGSILGLVVGDALGVPVEFVSRGGLVKEPIKDMIGFGTFNLPPGSWSDDSSMALCLTEALIDEYDLNKIASNFMSWIYEAKWTPFGKVFDVGNTTAMAMQMLKRGFSPDRSGSTESACNGNGSLMRTIPLLWYIRDKDQDTRYEITKEVSSITHANIVSILSCFYYLEYARQLSKGISVYGAIETTNNIFFNKATQKGIGTEYLKHFARFLMEGFDKIPEEEINSSGYVIDTLEASIWCLLNTNNYKDAVLKAVNLGEDTDTTAAVTGALAGIVYGLEGIPDEWLKQIARLNDIEQLINSFNDKYSKVIDT